ncbi:hypothetical protein F5Y15DRAFT_334342 [Xylariaceae sp. FL0016]|nr:hypothetical protein F5Y15DRAFT_334342 [Xylariaceae sp. FL0016]
MPHSNNEDTRVPRKLVLCFDGTGNTFTGTTADTNVVKIYDKLERHAEDQYHYYQTGIGTYDVGGTVNTTFLGSIRRRFSTTMDEAFATTFDAHVIAGYRFIMRYYEGGDKIYMFGFSRGAFTARFLARMINTIGLLSRGNEEMVPFAYQLYQEYEQGKVSFDEKKEASPSESEASTSDTDGHKGHDCDGTTKPADDEIDEMQQKRNKIRAFTNTFCRVDYRDNCYHRVKVYFLGLFDCVSSVKVLEGPFGKAPRPVSVIGTAEHVRHAVALDERRVKFKAALLAQDTHHPDLYKTKEDIKEVWFPGNHGDVGGGWPAPAPDASDKPLTWKDTITAIFRSLRPTAPKKDSREDPYQMSDVALHWMINEVKEVDSENPEWALKWSERLGGFEKNFNAKKETQAFRAPAHDTMRIMGGSSLFKVLLWNFQEWLPFLARWEIDESFKFYYERMWPNRGRTRDIPPDAVFHHSVYWRLENNKHYRPQNNLGGKAKACLTDSNALVERKPGDGVTEHVHHKTYVLKSVSDQESSRSSAEGASERAPLLSVD